MPTLLSLTTTIFPHFPSLSFLPNTSLISSPTPRLARLSLRAKIAESDKGEPSNGAASSSSSILWFKHDLRVDDHPGLIAAASNSQSLLPLYVFDHRILSREFHFTSHPYIHTYMCVYMCIYKEL